MKKQMVILGIAVVLIAVGLSGCEEQSSGTLDSRFVGTWTSLGSDFYFGIMELYADGLARITYSGSGDIHPAVWETEGDKLIINLTDSDYIYTFSYSLTNSETLVLTRLIDDQSFGPYTYKKS